MSVPAFDNLVERYRRQWRWRSWSAVFEKLPDIAGHTVLDLGCGIGDHASELVKMGARVIGFDLNDELLDAARARRLPNAEFRRQDISSPPDDIASADGLWCSFSAAYLIDLPTVLKRWRAVLRPSAWVALTEVDDLFGHQPLIASIRDVFETYAADALSARRYDFHMGSKLRRFAEDAGFVVTSSFTVPDAELCFEGPAGEEVLAAWSDRLDGMRLLKQFLGDDWDAVRDDFLACLSRADHTSTARVCCVMASTPSAA